MPLLTKLAAWYEALPNWQQCWAIMAFALFITPPLVALFFWWAFLCFSFIFK